MPLAILTTIRIDGVGNTTATQPKMINRIRPIVDKMRVTALDLTPSRDLEFRSTERFCCFIAAMDCPAALKVFLNFWRSRSTINLPVSDLFMSSVWVTMEFLKVWTKSGKLIVEGIVFMSFNKKYARTA
jgi:hypothetical protein